MSDIADRFQPIDPNNPLIVQTTASTFGGPDDSQDNGRFAYGGGSTLPDGSINPEPYAAVPKQLFDQGIVVPGQRIKVTNPENGQTAFVVARDVGPSAKNRGIDLAPHVMQSLGSDTDKPLIVDFSNHEAPSNLSLRRVPDLALGSGPIEPATAPSSSLEGIPELTPVGSGEPPVAGSTPPQGQYTPNQQILADATHPQFQSVSPNPKVVSHDDTKVVFDDGVTLYRDGTRQTVHAGHTFIQAPGQKTPVMIPDSAKDDPDTLFTKAAAAKGITPSQYPDRASFVDAAKTALGTRATTQAELLKLRMINSAKTQPGIQAYVNIKNNYDSLAQNAAIPADQRTPADDAAAMQAFASVEHPGIGATESDKKQAQDVVPFFSRLGLRASNILHNRANTLTSDAVAEMRDTAKRALDGRARTYQEQISPLIHEAGRVGLSPEEVNGILGANIAPSSIPSPSPTAPAASPTPTPIQPDAVKAAATRILADPNSSPETKAKAQRALEKLGQ